jgi:tetratricopeptide (TPR) repeat protein
LAQIYAELGKVDEAIASYEKLIELSYLPQWGYSTLGEYYAELGRCADAVDHFERALQIPGYDDRILWARLGLAYHCVARAQDSALADEELEEETLNAFAQALTVDQDGPFEGEEWIRHEYARVLYDYGDVTAAIEQFEQSLTVDDGPAFKTRRNLGQLYEQTGQTGLAIEQYEAIMAECADADLDLLLFVQMRLENLGGDSSKCDSLPKG